MASLVHPNIERLRMDVIDEASIKAAVNEIIEKDGRIDILVNNAGMTCSGKFPPVLCVELPVLTRVLRSYRRGRP